MTVSRTSAQSPLHAAVVGAGLMGRWHAHALSRAGGRVVAVMDVRAASAQQLAQAYHARAFDSLSELLRQTRVDVVHLCTPLETHTALAAQALEASAHVVVEKPLAPDAAQTEQLLCLAQARGRLLVPVHQFLFQAGVRRALSQLPRLVPLVHVESVTLTAGGEGMSELQRDQLVADVLPHALSLFQRCLPNGLEGVEWRVSHPASGELRATGSSVDTTLAITISTRGRPTRNELTIVGAGGTAHVDLFHGFAVFEDARVSRGQKILRPFGLAARTLTHASANLAGRALRGEVAYPGLRELIGAVYASIRSNTPPPISAQETLAVARARDTLMAAANIAAP